MTLTSVQCLDNMNGVEPASPSELQETPVNREECVLDSMSGVEPASPSELQETPENRESVQVPAVRVQQHQLAQASDQGFGTGTATAAIDVDYNHNFQGAEVIVFVVVIPIPTMVSCIACHCLPRSPHCNAFI